MADSLLAQVQEILLGQKNRLASWKGDVDDAVAHLNTSVGNGEVELHIDPVNGLDTNAGTTSSKLKTLPAAISIARRYKRAAFYIYGKLTVDKIVNFYGLMVKIYMAGHTLQFKRATLDEAQYSPDIVFPSGYTRSSHAHGNVMWRFIESEDVDIYLQGGNLVYPPCGPAEPETTKSKFFIDQYSTCVAAKLEFIKNQGITLRGKGIVSCIDPSTSAVSYPNNATVFGGYYNRNRYAYPDGKLQAVAFDVVFRHLNSSAVLQEVGGFADDTTPVFVSRYLYNSGIAAIISATNPIEV